MTDNEKILMEICERLSSIETEIKLKLRRIDLIEEKASTSFNKAADCDIKITKIEDNQKWLKRSIAAAFISFIASLILIVISYYLK